MVVAVLALSSQVVLAEPPSTPKSALETGIEGTISVSPIHGGPTRQGIPDSRPLANTEFLVGRQDAVVASFKTDQQGRFRITLPPGHYTISIKDRNAMGGSHSFEVDLAAGQMKLVHWDCDTGIR